MCIASFTCNLAPPPALQFSSEFITEIDIKRTDSRGLTLGSSLPPFITPSIQITLQSCSSQITEWWGNKRWDWSKALDDYGPDPVRSLQCPDAVSPPAALTVIKQSVWWATATPAFTGVVFVSDHFLSRVRCTSPVLCVAETVFYVLLLFRRESTSKVFYYICLIEERQHRASARAHVSTGTSGFFSSYFITLQVPNFSYSITGHLPLSGHFYIWGK